MKEKFLPIGTVVLLKNGTKKIMITGYLPVSKKDDKKMYDYSACLFPEGIISSDQTAVFNHEQIAEIIQEGYSNEETDKFVTALKEVVLKQISHENTPVENKPIEQPKIEEPPKIEDIPKEEPITDIVMPEVLDINTPPATDNQNNQASVNNLTPNPGAAPIEIEMPTIKPVEAPKVEMPSLAINEPIKEPTNEIPMEVPLDLNQIPVAGGEQPAVGVESIKPFSE